MSGLVKRLRKYGDDPYDVSLGEIAEWFHKSADRIEELELAVTQLQAEAYKANRRAELADGWRDHDKERAEKAEKEVERLRRDNGILHDTVEKVFAEGAKQLARADTAWNDAIEAAAQVADDCRKSAFTAGMGMQPVIEAIRALKRSE